LRDSEGPPPEEVPKKVTVIHCDMIQVRMYSGLEPLAPPSLERHMYTSIEDSRTRES
jgi:hypothetical protein